MWAAAIPALISAAGSFIGGERANAAQTGVAREQMAFQERMSSTAHQREVDDLRAAGLNPMLSARLGGASSPAGAMPNIRDTVGDATRAGVSSAMQSVALEAQLDNTQAQTGKLKAETKLTELEQYKTATESQLLNTELNNRDVKLKSDIGKTQADTGKSQQELRNLGIDYLAKQYGLSTAKAAEALGDIDSSFYRSTIGKALRWAELSSDAINPLVNSADSLSRIQSRR